MAADEACDRCRLPATRPPGIQNAMITANATRDRSKINLGGAVRVADLKDSFTGETATNTYRTILIIGSRELGFVDVFDISVPRT